MSGASLILLPLPRRVPEVPSMSCQKRASAQQPVELAGGPRSSFELSENPSDPLGIVAEGGHEADLVVDELLVEFGGLCLVEDVRPCPPLLHEPHVRAEPSAQSPRLVAEGLPVRLGAEAETGGDLVDLGPVVLRRGGTELGAS
eukprot:CAMPEP_0115547594 /NCGR_PEP_ID=MMETSP0271-20121206/93725_1 /TAXON_ID=71861 /ORGANISM="Scrippsiella trochoidea, Strain CCMP3099" /LENGTH=143 /DNA_ID=CAMNT_0002981027 /DNA_START=43 /DNA_END=474 /DNA_ORIENTATION=+